MMSTARSAMRFESSWMVMASGMTISRDVFSVGNWKPWDLFLMRSVRRRKAATEWPRWFSSSSSALPTVRRPRRPFFSISALVRVGTATGLTTRVAVGRARPGRAPALGRAPLPWRRGASSSSTSTAAVLGASRLAASSALRRPSSSCLWPRARSDHAHPGPCASPVLLPGACVPRPHALCCWQGRVRAPHALHSSVYGGQRRALAVRDAMLSSIAAFPGLQSWAWAQSWYCCGSPQRVPQVLQAHQRSCVLFPPQPSWCGHGRSSA
jgi:hypothetical protein